MKEVDTYYHDDTFGYDFFKDGLTSHQEITPNKSYFLLNIENIVLDNKFSTYSRTAFFSVAYPLYKNILLSSIIPFPKESRKTKVPGITYDDSFYKKIGVPTYRSYSINLQIS
jgi:hypothetical protein